MSEWAKTHQPCPCGKSSDAYSVNTDGWGTCFSCTDDSGNHKRFPPENQERNYEMADVNQYEFKYMSHRGLSESVMKKYHVVTKLDKDTKEPVEICFPYPRGDFKKIRSFLIPKKSKGHFRTVGVPKEAGLFGQDRFQPGCSDTIIITEGEFDALASYEMTKLPSVSVASASSARADLSVEHVHQYINSFEKIVLAFDGDEAGQDAVSKVAGLFDFTRVYNADLSLHKDANAFLEKNATNEYLNAIRHAKKFTPDNIINTFAGMKKALKGKTEKRSGTYPFKKLQDMLFGCYQDEVILIKADTGIGKTEFFRALEYHILKTEPESKHCIIHLEEGNDTTIRGLATYEDKFPYIHLNDETEDDVIMSAVEKLVKDESRLNIYESFDLEDDRKLMDTVRYLVSICGVTHVWLDHITWLATGKEGDEDERRKLDRISQKIKLLAKELHFTFFFITHINAEGVSRGSKNMENVANTIIRLSRDKEAEVEAEKHKLWLSIQKGRGHGTQTGPAGYVVFNTDTLVLEDPFTGVEFDAPEEDTRNVGETPFETATEGSGPVALLQAPVSGDDGEDEVPWDGAESA